ncbi:MAG TPA: hypothetical protein VMF30_10650 [Pirellulales bacterium]|nr:hypothetical protein [Pirellulales bacterium]
MIEAPEKRSVVRLAPQLVELLARLRRAIRAYAWTEGIALVVAVLAGSFWLSLALDWLFEPPAPLRIGLLAVVAVALVWVAYWFILRRIFVHLADRSLALVLERRFGQFRDSLVTAVELSQAPAEKAEFDPAMFDETQRQALAGATALPLARVFDLKLLARRTLLAIVLLGAVVGFGVTQREALAIWARRSLLLSDEMWPRKTHLVAVGFDPQGHTKIARGADLDLVVQAEAAPGREAPETVEIRYEQGSSRGRETMGRSGNAAIEPGALQNYVHAFKAVLTPLKFYIRGGDDRLGPLYIDVVDSPTVGQMMLHCEYPEYMHREPRDVRVAGAMSIPRGTRVTVHAETNKDIVQLRVDDLSEEQTPVANTVDLAAGSATGSRQFEYVIPTLDRDTTLRFTLLDVDGIRSRDPVRLSLAAVDDEAPQVRVQLAGIGTAITSKARLPIAGEISDDYGVARAWFECHSDEDAPVDQPLSAKIAGQDRLPVDEAIEVERFSLQPKHKFHLAALASDTCGLADGPKTGISQRWVLDVVTPEQLRSMLEARELLLRRRFETIVQELTESRDALARIDLAPPATKEVDKPKEGEKPKEKEAQDAAQPAAEKSPAVDPNAPSAAERLSTLRRVQAERALQNCQRSADETLGLAAAFDSIREELINNRVDTEELKLRLKEGIADPLRGICSDQFPELERRLQTFQAQLADPTAATAARDAAREQADAILVQMRQILDKMLELETFNEVLDLLRGIIDSQEQISRETKQKKKDKVKRLLDDDEGSTP